jgi:X-Pro dipeptidyl-peptidase
MRILAVATLLIALQAAGSPPATAPQFVNGLAQPVFEGQEVIRHNVWVEIPGVDSDRDGVNDRIRAQISRPAATEKGTKLPVVLAASPYTGGTMPYPRHDLTGELYVPGQPSTQESAPPVFPRPTSPYFGTEPPIRDINASSYQTYFLPRGFIFADANSLGTGASTGCPSIGGIEENLAIKALIDWFNGRGKGYDAEGREVTAYWTTGATTMIGTSFVGTLPIGAASLGVEGLKAIVPIAGVSSYYDHRRSYGTVINSYPMAGTDADTLFDNILSRKYPEVCAHMRDQIARGKDRTTGDYNAWWDERNYYKDAAKFRAAVLISHGLNDFNVKPRHAARLWAALEAANVPAKIWWNQGGHGDRANAPARQAAWRDMLNRFWSHHLFGVKNGVMDGPRAVVERENNEWVEYPDWPIPGAKPTTFYPHPGPGNGIGELGSSRRPVAPGATELIVDNSAIDANVLVAAMQSPHRLVYQTAVLTTPVHVSGIPEVSLRLSFNRPAAIVSAMLVDYRATDKPFIVTRGWADPQNRESLSRTTPIVPGTPYTIAFELQPHDYIFPVGSRIGFVVMSSDWLFTLRPPPGTELTLTAAQSTLTLPVVRGSGVFSTDLADQVPVVRNR